MHGMGVMSSPWASSQASAICAGVAPASAATARTSSTMRRLRFRLPPLKRGLVHRARHASTRDSDAAGAATQRFALATSPARAGRTLISVAVGFGESDREYVPNTAHVVITADVWTDKKEVARAFATAQRQLLGDDNRKKPDKVLETVRFVARQGREHGSRPSWRKLREAWNREHPDTFYMDHSELHRDFKRFVHPKYNRPKWKRRRH